MVYEIKGVYADPNDKEGYWRLLVSMIGWKEPSYHNPESDTKSSSSSGSGYDSDSISSRSSGSISSRSSGSGYDSESISSCSSESGSESYKCIITNLILVINKLSEPNSNSSLDINAIKQERQKKEIITFSR